LHEIYVILGWVGWIWLGVWLLLLATGLLVQNWNRRRRRARNGVREFEVTVSDEKQS
jgi:cytochrome c biogenesis factor